MSFGADEPEEDTSAEDEKNDLEKKKLERLKNSQFLKNTTVSTQQSRQAQGATAPKPTLSGR
tara:strand:- start:1809 stop:1994 length:186 start_codon:yes stop_codon:yes gene_type:complete